MAETRITEEDMRQFGAGIPAPTGVQPALEQTEEPSFFSREAGQARTRALEDALEYYIPREVQQPIRAFNEYVNPVTAMGEAQVDTQRAFNPELSTSERLKAAGSALINTGMSSIPLLLAAKRYLTPAQAAVDTLVGFGNTTPDVPAGATDDLIKAVDEFSGVTPTPTAAPPAPPRTLFREGTTSNVADFYSPARELLDATNYPNKGLKGSEAIKLLRNAPDVRQAEIDLLPINPQTRYTREELLDLVDNNSYTITAERSDNLDWTGAYTFAGTQRQPLSNNFEQLDYEETIIRAQNANQRVAAREGTHHTPDTIAHLRTSRQQNMDTGEKIYLVEEIQSDLVSRGSRQPRGEVTPLEGIVEDADLTLDLISEAKDEFRHALAPHRELLRDYYLYSVSKGQRMTDNAGREIPTIDFIGKYGLSTNTPMNSDINRFLYNDAVPRVPLKTASGITTTIGDRSLQTAYKTDAELVAPIGQAPIRDINEVVRIGLQTAISDALANGDTKVVIPNLERIVSSGRARPGTEDWDKMTKPGSSFHRMYVTGLQKAISELQKDLPELSVGSMDLSYSQYPDLPSNATVLDLSAYSDQNLNTLRFAEGGMVDPKDNAVFRHHLENVRSGNSVKNEDGSVSTIRTIIMGDGENEYLIPTVWGGRILSDEEAFNKAMNTGIAWPKAPAGEEGVRYLQQLDRQIHAGFAEGGLAMEKQMKNLMANGGLNDDGMRVDPVSGNEVPPGSMAEEVRDDIPAQLSGGEYVVPADVVRYYGVKFFEDLRSEAKGGLMEMEQDGRIGGEPTAGPAQLSPEDMAALQQIAMAAEQGGSGQVAMSTGGMIPPMNQDKLIENIISVVKSDPDLMGKLNQRGVMLYEGGMVDNKYADGGLTVGPSFNPAQWQTVGGSYFGNTQDSPQAPIENQVYRGPNGESVTIRFQNGVPLDTIPTGYVPEAQYVAPTLDLESTQGNRDRDRSPYVPPTTPTGGNDRPTGTLDENGMYRGVSFEDPLGAAEAAVSGMGMGGFGGRALTGLGYLAAGPVGAGVAQSATIGTALSQARANLRVAQERGMDEDAAKIQKIVDDLEGRLGGFAGDITDLLASGDQRFDTAWDVFTQAGLTGMTPSGVIQGTEVVSSTSLPSSGRDTSGAGIGRAKAMTAAEVQAGQDYAKKGDDRDTSWAGGKVATTQTKPTYTSDKEREDAVEKAVAATGVRATGGRARGGLMGKANRT